MKKFARKVQLKRHMVNIHERKRPFSCTLCSSTFFRKGDLKLHMKTVHEGKKPFECNYCTKKFYLMSGLDGHLAIKHAMERARHSAIIHEVERANVSQNNDTIKEDDESDETIPVGGNVKQYDTGTKAVNQSSVSNLTENVRDFNRIVLYPEPKKTFQAPPEIINPKRVTFQVDDIKNFKLEVKTKGSFMFVLWKILRSLIKMKKVKVWAHLKTKQSKIVLLVCWTDQIPYITNEIAEDLHEDVKYYDKSHPMFEIMKTLPEELPETDATHLVLVFNGMSWEVAGMARPPTTTRRCGDVGGNVKHCDTETKAENQIPLSDLNKDFFKCMKCDKDIFDFTEEWYIADYTTPDQRTFLMEELLKQHLKEDHQDEAQEFLKKKLKEDHDYAQGKLFKLSLGMYCESNNE